MKNFCLLCLKELLKLIDPEAVTHTYIYILYIYTHIQTHIHTHKYRYIYIYMCICKYTYVQIHMYMCICVLCFLMKALVVSGVYNNWDKVDPAELFSKAPTEKKEANPKLNMVKFLQVSEAADQQGALKTLALSALWVVTLLLSFRWKPEAVTTWCCGWTVTRKERTSALRYSRCSRGVWITMSWCHIDDITVT